MEDRTGSWFCSWCMQSLCSSGLRVRVAEEACWVYVYKAIAPTHKPHCPVSSCCYILNIGGPGEATRLMISDAQVSTCWYLFPVFAHGGGSWMSELFFAKLGMM